MARKINAEWPLGPPQNQRFCGERKKERSGVKPARSGVLRRPPRPRPGRNGTQFLLPTGGWNGAPIQSAIYRPRAKRAPCTIVQAPRIRCHEVIFNDSSPRQHHRLLCRRRHGLHSLASGRRLFPGRPPGHPRPASGPSPPGRGPGHGGRRPGAAAHPAPSPRGAAGAGGLRPHRRRQGPGVVSGRPGARRRADRRRAI